MPDLDLIRLQLRAIQRQLEDAPAAEQAHTERLHRLVLAAAHEANDIILLGPSCAIAA